MAVLHQSILAANPNDLLIIDAINLANQASDASRTLSISSHQVGDMILVMTGNRLATAPALLSGYTNILNINSVSGTPRSLRLQYKIATATTESATWTGSYGYICAIRNATLTGQTNSINTNSTIFNTNTYSLPDISNLNSSGSKIVISGTYSLASGVFNSVSSPYVVYNSSNLSQPCFVYANKNNQTSLTSKTAVNGAVSFTNVLYTIEIL